MNRAATIQGWRQAFEGMGRSLRAARAARQTMRDLGDVARIRASRMISDRPDEERRRSVPDAPSIGKGAPSSAIRSAPAASGRIEGGLSGYGQGGALGRARMLAAGYQPAVIKVVSYARGVARATATGQYMHREDVPLETHDGRMLTDREAVAEEIKAWSSTFSKRAESQDVAAIRVRLDGVKDTAEARQTFESAIAAGFVGHRYAARVDVLPSGELEAQLVVAMAGRSRERFRIRDRQTDEQGRETASRRLDSVSDAAVKGRIKAITGVPANAIRIMPGATSHGRDGVTYRLNKLLEKGPATDDIGKVLTNAADARVAAREWGRSLRSQSSRDTMHLIVSAKAGTDVAALTSAARAFFQDRFADHNFMFGVHTDRESDGHIHVHAVVAVRNESGHKIHPGRETFDEWRRVYAEHARAQGLKIVATSARERASSQSYGPKDKAIVDAADRPRASREARDRTYANDPANQRLISDARSRIAAARANPVRIPISADERRAVGEGFEAWRTISAEQPGNRMAQKMLDRLERADVVGATLHTIDKRVSSLTREESQMAVTSQQMTKDLRLMNEAVARTGDLLDGQTKQQFQDAAGRYLETLAHRIDFQRAHERGVEGMTRAEVESIAGISAARLVEHAREIQAKEAQEAASAERLADRAVETERRTEAHATQRDGERDQVATNRHTVRDAERVAAREQHEARAVADATRAIIDHPTNPVPEGARPDALTALRLEQRRIRDELERDELKGQAARPQRMR